VLLLISTAKHKELERELHLFAQGTGLSRLGKLEIFKCSNQQQFVGQLRDYIK